MLYDITYKDGSKEQLYLSFYEVVMLLENEQIEEIVPARKNEKEKNYE